MTCIKETQTGEFTVEETDVLRKLENDEEMLRSEMDKLQEELEIINNWLYPREHDSDTDFGFQQRYNDTMLYHSEVLQEEADTLKAQDVTRGGKSKLDTNQQELAEMFYDDPEHESTPEIKPNEFYHPENKDHCRFYL